MWRTSSPRNFCKAAVIALQRGLIEEIPYLKSQQRLTFARLGITDPSAWRTMSAHGGYRGLASALAP